jgi:uncharacterized peroxidase-related enzyme
MTNADRWVETIKRNYTVAELSPADREMLDFVVKLTRNPASMCEEDVSGLREHGFDDTAISDIVQVAALFNYYDRLADGLGIDPEPEWGS